MRKSFVLGGVLLTVGGGWGVASAADIVVAAGTVESSQQSVAGADTLTVEAGGALSVDGGAVVWNGPSTSLRIVNGGVIESLAEGGRAINAGGAATAPRSLVLSNLAGGIIRSEGDAFRINLDVSGGTIVVNNAGLIHSTVDGQALDFNAIATGGATVQINNLAGGVMQADGADGIRPGQGAVVTNAGVIRSNSPIGETHDGVDWQDKFGSVINQTGGLISGQRHGITSDVHVDVVNEAGAVIEGRNGSGVGSDGSGRVINYGRITGAADGGPLSDGDGVDIDFAGYVENWGIIEGTGAAGLGSDGWPNIAEGVIIGGGVIINHEGGVIRGGYTAIGLGPTTLVVNEGRLEGPIGLLAYGDQDQVIVNAGVIDAPTAIWLEGGDDILVIQAGSQINGLVELNDGFDTVVLEDGAVFDFARGIDHLQAEGDATVIGTNATTSVYVASGARLQIGNGGTTGSVSGAITTDGVLAIDRSDAVTLASVIDGAGGLEQAGSGTTVIAADMAFTGATRVLDGELRLQGDLADSTVQLVGGRLTGQGLIGGLDASGGVLEAGALQVAGDARLGGGSSVRLRLGQTFQVGGQLNLEGAALQLTAPAGAQLGVRYQVMQAAGGVEGAFSGTNLVNEDGADIFTLASLDYAALDVGVVLDIDLTGLAAAAGGGDRAAILQAAADLPDSNLALTALAATTAATAPAALDQLSGALHPSAAAALVQDAGDLPAAVLSQMAARPAGVGGRAWASLGARDRELDGDGAAASVSGSVTRLSAGADWGFGDRAVVGLFLSHVDGDADLDQAGGAELSGLTFGGYGQFGAEGLVLRAGAAYGAWSIETRREVAIGGFRDTLSSDSDANSLQLFGEIAYAMDREAFRLEPYAGLAWLNLDGDGWSETGGDAALEGSGADVSTGYTSLGVRGSLARSLGALTLRPAVDLAWRHRIGDDDAAQSVRFVDGVGTARAVIRGAGLAQDELRVSAGLELDGEAWSAGAGYVGVVSDTTDEHGLNLSLRFNF